METVTPLLAVRGLAKAFNATRVFADVAFTLARGEHLAVLGPSGCGKTTLFRLLAGFDAPDAGEIDLENRAVSRAGRVQVPPHERGLGILFQDLALWPMLTVADNVAMGLASLRLPRAEAASRVAAMLALCYIAAHAARKPGTLSLGQQQRTALARALIARPRLLLLDEPFSALDLTLKEKLFADIRRLTAQCGSTLLLVTHDPLEARALCTHALVLEDGHVAEQGALGELLAAPRSLTLQAFARQFRI